MRIAVKCAACLLAVLPLLQGCDQKNKVAQTQPLAPPIVDAPPEKPATVSAADLPPPVIGSTQPATPPPDTSATKPAEPPKKPTRHPKKPATTPATEETAKAAQPSPPSSVSAIGQLSGGASGDLRSQTEDTINAVEKGVNGITRSLNDSETKTVAQIREFLKEARQALETGDTDGARTLANKAKVLLSELNPQ